MGFISCFMLGSHHVAWADLDLSILVFCSVLFFFPILLLNFVFVGRLQGQRAEARGWGISAGLGCTMWNPQTINEKFWKKEKKGRKTDWCLVMNLLPNWQKTPNWLCLHMAERSASMSSFSDKNTHPGTVTVYLGPYLHCLPSKAASLLKL